MLKSFLSKNFYKIKLGLEGMNILLFFVLAIKRSLSILILNSNWEIGEAKKDKKVAIIEAYPPTSPKTSKRPYVFLKKYNC